MAKQGKEFVGQEIQFLWQLMPSNYPVHTLPLNHTNMITYIPANVASFSSLCAQYMAYW